MYETIDKKFKNEHKHITCVNMYNRIVVWSIRESLGFMKLNISHENPIYEWIRSIRVFFLVEMIIMVILYNLSYKLHIDWKLESITLWE